MDFFASIVSTISGWLYSYILIALLIGAGLYFTVRTGFVQFSFLGESIRVIKEPRKDQQAVSSFQALMVSTASRVGTGNIIGVTGAIIAGGPGAVFWMWIIAFLGMATIYAEATLAQETRVTDADGEVHGGPVYYIKKAFPNGFGTFLAVFFAIAAILALGFMGSMVQSNSIAESTHTAFGISNYIVGAVLAIICAIIFIGGIQRIASVAEKLVPIMAILFLTGGLIVLACNLSELVEGIKMIFKYAFTPQALIGGGIGAALKTAISQGAKRGLFSNEAGMGSTPHAHAMANVEKPHDQGVAAMIGVFIDTFVVLTMTALVVITTLYTGEGGLGNMTPDAYQAVISGSEPFMNVVLSKTNAIQIAMTNGLPNFMSSIGNGFVAICLLFFAFTTIIGWNFFGKINVQYLFKNNKIATVAYSVIAIVFLVLGTLASNDLVWELTDFFNYLMVIPNVIALSALYKLIVKNAKK